MRACGQEDARRDVVDMGGDPPSMPRAGEWRRHAVADRRPDAPCAAAVSPSCCPRPRVSMTLRRAHDESGGSPIVSLVETPLGCVGAIALAASGAVDPLGARQRRPSSRARSRSRISSRPSPRARGLVIASAAAGLARTGRRGDDPARRRGRLVDDVAHGRELGFGGKLCIHPRQVAVVNVGDVARAPEELDWAQQVVSQAREGVVVVDGAMVDAPVVARARRF